MRQKIGKVCMILGALLILASAVLLAYNKWDASRADKAAQQALEHCSQSILTSGLTFFAATFGVAVISQIELMRSICLLISRGALISTVVILVVLPAALMLLDGLIRRTTLGWLPSAAPQMSEKE